jgi:hypothetical protein
MSIFSFLQGKKKDSLVALFDIGSSHVTGALVRFSHAKPDTRPHIVVSKSFSIPLDKKPEYEHLVKSTLTTIEETARFLESQHLGSPEYVVCVVGAPWYTAHTRTIAIQQKDSFVFTKKLADSLIEKEFGIIEKELDTEKQYVLVENKTVSVRLNGYETAHPIGKKTKNIELSLFTSYLPQDFHSAIQKKIHRFFHRNPIIHTSLFAHTTMLRDMFPDDHEYLLVDISGETTECSVTRNGLLVESHSFPVGTNNVIRQVSAAEKKSHLMAQQLFDMYLKDALHGVHNASIEKKLEKIRTEWQRYARDVFTLLSKRLLLPDKIFLFGNKHTLPWFQDILDDESFHQMTFTHKKFKITPMNPALVHSLCTFQDGVSRDTCVMIDTVFIYYYIHKK